jgi:tRNA A-37 threonylcarbamoyl transferase component Bud32/tetratricopeptide (TPR) repeat protein
VEAPSTKRFAIRRRLGAGGMGIVYEAFDEERHVAVALKVLNRIDGDGLARFKREFRALQGLAHPNLVALDELFFDDGRWFFTMELLDGADFMTHLCGPRTTPELMPTVRTNAARFETRDAASNGDASVRAAFDEEALREALRQLLEGLAMLHAAGKVHRDIKPSNVLVTREGRVVLLDFGLVTEESSEGLSTGTAIVGTPEYMAPEQGASGDIGTAADLYALGVMLYEVLTGVLPFNGTPLQILIDKQGREPPLTSAVVPRVPPDLDALCASLLRFDPARRPSAADILRSLARQPRSRNPAAHRTPSGAPMFVGRGSELGALRAAWDTTAAGKLTTVLLCGESGVGKSFTARRFTTQLQVDCPDLVLLEGRCYEREAVPYKTLDGIVDALSRRLARMTEGEVRALLPTRSAVLAQVFPAMLRVPDIAKEYAARSTSIEPHELRRRAFLGLRDLFTRVALKRRTAVVIDDLQWADDEGLRALVEVLRPPAPPPLLLLGTVRMSGAGGDAALARLCAAIPGDVRVLRIANLQHDEARQLAAALLERTGATENDLETIVREASGHPLFVEELARHVASGGSARDEVKLDDAIWSRIALLEPATRDLAELVAIAGKPIPQEIVVAAARGERVDFNRRVGTLRASNIARTGGARWVDAIEPYHDRVREAVLAQLDEPRRRALHERLAIAFEASSHGDAETLATHWRGAGHRPFAARHAIAAGDQAQSTFAFDRAAEWYEQALELLPDSGSASNATRSTPEAASRREVRIKLGNALASAGRGALAAPHFEAVATESDPAEALELRRRVAEQLLRSGVFDRGMEVSRAVLAGIGMRMPSTRFGALVTLLYYRALLGLRGLRFQERPRARITPEQLAYVDTCWSIGFALGFADSFMGIIFMTRALLLALSAGEIERIIRGVSAEVAITGTEGGPAWPRMQKLVAYSRELAKRSGSIQARYFAFAGPGFGFFLSGRFREAADDLSAALDLLKDGSSGFVYEHVTARIFMIESLHYMGGYAELGRLQDEGMRSAVERGDVYATVSMRIGHCGMAWLVEDRPDVADDHAVAAIAEWSSRALHVEHILGLVARVHAKLYADDPEHAHALASEMLRRQRESLLWRLQITRLRSIHHRGTTALAMIERGLGDRDALLREAEQAARATERERVEWAQPFAMILRAGIALRSDARARAIGHLDAAAREFDAAAMKGYAAATRDRAARLRADDSTAQEIEHAAEFFRSEGVLVPDRMIATLAPGLLAR